MAEAHPVGFQWVMEAKKRGAKIFHVDPRFTRTSAVADRFIPIRAGSDIAFLGGIVRYILDNELDFREYVLAYTNAATIVREDFADTEDLDGLFSGFDKDTRTYDPSSWQYEGHTPDSNHDESGDTQAHRETAAGLQHESHGPPVPSDTERDETLQHPRCVYQILKRHFARYTPELVEQVCGVPPEAFREICEAWTANSGRERTTALVYSVGWTQHSVGVQYIRTGAIIQLLLGNMGRPGGGVMALRGHASIQGSTDIPTLFNLLPGYLPMPRVDAHQSLSDWIDSIRHPGQKGFWANAGAYGVSLLKAYFGDAATAENDYCFDHLPRLTGDHGTYQQVLNMIDGKVKGYFLLGQNPAVGSAHGKAQRLGMANLDWLVVRDLYEIESANFWRDGPEVETGEIVTTECRTEVFLMPAASHVEKEGTFTQTQRMLQWREKALDPPGDARSELWFFFHLGRLIRERLAGSTLPRDRRAARPGVGLPGARPARRAQRGGRAPRDQRLFGGRRPSAVGLRRVPRRRLDRRRVLDLLGRVRRRREPGGPAQAAHRAERDRAGVGLGVAGEPAHPLQPRLRRPRTAGRGASARPMSGGTPKPASGPVWTSRLREDQAAELPPAADASGPAALAGDDAFIMQGDGKGWLYVPVGLIDGPMPTHYEPVESPVENALYGQQTNPTRKAYPREENRDNPSTSDVYPFIFTTSRLTEHHTAGGMSRTLEYLSELQPAMFVEVSPALAELRGLEHMGWAHVVTARSVVEARVLVTARLRPLRVDRRELHQIWLPYHWGSSGLVTGDSTNDLIGINLDPNVLIQESKVGTCDINPGDVPTGPALLEYVEEYRKRAGI
jgi:formate dehydrogenase major subunit